MEKMIYMVTGAAGFLGSNICRTLLEQGKQVRAFVLPHDKYAQYLPKEVEIIEGDLTDVNSLERLFSVEEGTKTAMIHCGSVVTVDPGYNPILIKVNVDGTQNIINKCLEHKECVKMVYVGSTGSIPEAPKGTPICEVDSYDPEKVVGWYSKSKAMACQKVLDAVKNQGLNACIVHPAGIMGPNDYSKSTTTGTVLKILNGEMPVGMKGSFNMCDVRDLAAGCVSAVEKGRKGESYILGNEEVTLKELFGYLSADIQCKPIRFYLPLWMANIMAGLMEKKAAKNHTKPLMTRFSVYNLARNNKYDYSKAKAELGYTTRSYAETAKDMIKFLIESNQFIPAA